jgi:hypothetical protein
MRPKDDVDRRIEEFLKEHPLNDPKEKPKPKPIRLATTNPHVPLQVQGERIKQKVGQYKADHDREMKALREEEKRADEWRREKAREQQTALLQQKLDLARYAQLELGEPKVKHEYNPYSRCWMYGAE